MARTDIVQCQACHGMRGGEDTGPMYPDDRGPWEPCGCCAETGRTTKMMNAWIMRWARHPSFNPSSYDQATHNAAMRTAGLIWG
jgi:hypothetical protein